MAVNENRANAALSKRSDGHEAATNTGWRSSPSTPLIASHRIEREGDLDLGICQLLSWWYGSLTVHPPSPSSSVSPSLIESIVEEQCLNSVQTCGPAGRVM